MKRALWLNPKRLFSLFREILRSWSTGRLPRLGAALAFYTLFAMAPLFVIVLAVAGLWFGPEATQHELHTQLQGLMGEQGSQAIESLIAAANKPKTGVWATLVAGFTLILGATGVFVELQDSLNTIWKVERLPGRGLWIFIRSRLLSFAMVLGIGFLLLVSLILSAALAWFGRKLNGLSDQEWLWQTVNFILSLGVITALFTTMFKVLPDVRIRWRDAWLGGFLTAVLFNVGKFFVGLYLGKSSVASAFGAAGSLVIALLWVYYSAQILFFGALFTRVYATQAGAGVKPAPGAHFVTQTEARSPAPSGAH